MKIAPLVLLVAMSCFGCHASLAQHAHGVVELGVVFEDDKVAVSVIAPLSDVVGFEHVPKNDEQVAKVEKAASMLASADKMFGLAESADCEISDTSIDGPPYITERVEEEGSGAAEHSHDHHGANHSHDGESAYEKDAESSDHHDHDHEQHTEINANYEWACADASKLDVLELRFTTSFANVETIKIQLLTATGAQVLTMEGRVASIPLSLQ